jgi:hypothetical protein
VVKQVLRIAADRQGYDEGRLFHQTRGVIFLGTPNLGSHLTNWADRFRTLLRPSEATQGLVANDAYLRDLNMWYRDHSADVGIKSVVFFETRPTNGVMVVEAMSADPGLSGARPVPIDADHISISKPSSRDTTLYRVVRHFVDEVLIPARLGVKARWREEAIPTCNEFDVFISHSSAQRAWVEAFASNLRLAGKSVFLDFWRLIPGRDWIDGLRTGLASCKSAILVVSPEALQSGWVREEYEVLRLVKMRIRHSALCPLYIRGLMGNHVFWIHSMG